MLLIGMFDSPFVRRVAISMKLLGVAFEHANWSVGKDLERIRTYNPLGRVPTLVLDNNESLFESGAILDYLDEQAGPDRALLPRMGKSRRDALLFMAMASGAAEKGVVQIYERAFRPAEKVHEPWLARCRQQVASTLTALEQACQQGDSGQWLIDKRMTQADITVACAVTFLQDAVQVDLSAYPHLQTLTARCEALPEFQSTRLPFFTPNKS
jgi:glutathione S-transferase